MCDYDEEAGFGLSHYEAIQNNIKKEPRFTAEEREAMEALVSLSEYSEIHLSKLLNNGRKSAIATVRQMLEEEKP